MSKVKELEKRATFVASRLDQDGLACHVWMFSGCSLAEAQTDVGMCACSQSSHLADLDFTVPIYWPCLVHDVVRGCLHSGQARKQTQNPLRSLLLYARHDVAL